MAVEACVEQAPAGARAPQDLDSILLRAGEDVETTLGHRVPLEPFLHGDDEAVDRAAHVDGLHRQEDLQAARDHRA
ncbi:MAG: hypothetical protein A2138_21135 [Deltaproteobacteria bacterium RBG_16_71_12]|nr:MAG: hypothetical protein A2138_21135 [Deltaproteobacteria bacterium RBG_16_71_12]